MKHIDIEDVHRGNDNLEVFLFNVGQGDHIMLKFPNMEYGLIDFFYDTEIGVLEPPCLTYFRELERTLDSSEFEKITISFFCISHTDKDHVKGICETVEWFDSHGIFIREFWLGAARDEAQLINFLESRTNSAIKDLLPLIKKKNHSKQIDLYKDGINGFFKAFNRWKKKEFSSIRYKRDSTGKGEYLHDIRGLKNPCSTHYSRATNIGPLYSQLDGYINNLTIEILYRILKIKDNHNQIDKNLLSHILKIEFGNKMLMFGGDTHKDIWEECIETYLDPSNPYRELHGRLDSNFIKVSHHGSSNSSSATIWENILCQQGAVYLGISAGQHEGYKHPHSATMSEIRKCRSDVDILATNICGSCTNLVNIERELHSWYDKGIKNCPKYKPVKPSKEDKDIDYMFDKTRYIEKPSVAKSRKNLGLLAYIFEVPKNDKEEVKVRFALAQTIKSHGCFYKGHTEKLYTECK